MNPKAFFLQWSLEEVIQNSEKKKKEKTCIWGKTKGTKEICYLVQFDRKQSLVFY